VEAFESAVCEIAKVSHCIAVNSGTSALHLGMLAAGVGPGDEVIVPSFSFAATANAVALTGASVVFADICDDDFNIDPDHVSSLISPRTKAVLAVHLYGHPARLDELSLICDRAGILLFEDAAQALGALNSGKPVGGIGHFGIFSFYATKNVSSGEGGMIATNSPELARTARLLRNQGQEVKYRNEIVGFNNRMSDIHAAIGRVQLQNLSFWDSQRQRNAERLTRNLSGVHAPTVRENCHHAFHQYTIRVEASVRDALMEHLNQTGIQSAVYYPTPIHQLPAYKSQLDQFKSAPDLRTTERAASEVLSLPVHPRLSLRQVDSIIDAINSFTQA